MFIFTLKKIATNISPSFPLCTCLIPQATLSTGTQTEAQRPRVTRSVRGSRAVFSRTLGAVAPHHVCKSGEVPEPARQARVTAPLLCPCAPLGDSASAPRTRSLRSGPGREGGTAGRAVAPRGRLRGALGAVPGAGAPSRRPRSAGAAPAVGTGARRGSAREESPGARPLPRPVAGLFSGCEATALPRLPSEPESPLASGTR